MSVTYFTIGLDPKDTTINDTTLPDGLKQAYIDNFASSVVNPLDIDACIANFEKYALSQVTAANVAASITVPVMPPSNTVTQLDMDGNIIVSSAQPYFSRTKEQSKDILGSVEKINESDILVADAINKRAIIVSTVTQRIKWEYVSDRYVIDAHIIPQLDTTIKVNQSNCASEDINVNVGQIVIWENNMSVPIVIYSGDISDVDIYEDFDANLYGQTFESVTLEVGDRWSYRFLASGDYQWFSYPNAYRGKVVVSSEYISPNLQVVILESDCLESPYSSRVKKIDVWGNVLQEFGSDGFLVKPRDARPQLNGKVLIST